MAPKAGRKEAKGCQRRGQSLPWRPLSLPFSSFGRVRRTPRKHWQGQYKRRVGPPTAGQGNTLRQAKRGQGKPRQARRGQVRPKAALGGRTWPPEGQAGEVKEGKESPGRPCRRGLESQRLFGQAFEANRRGRGNSPALPEGGGGVDPLLKDGSSPWTLLGRT